MASRNSQRLELTWFNKDKALIPSARGRYGYDWVDPRDPRYCEVHTLVEVGAVEGAREEELSGQTYSPTSRLAPTVDNLLICGESGDVLEALHHVPELAEKYVGKVKLCAIDPPFNTLNLFRDYDDGLEHSIWLTLMRDRLIHIKKLLSPDGTIWVHLDDSENHRMRSLLDEVFGAEQFVAELAVEMNPKGRQLGDGLARSHDTIYVYARTQDVRLNSGDASQVDLSDFPHRTGDGVPFRFLPLRNTNKKFNPQTARTMYFPLYGCAKTGKVATQTFPGAVEVWPVFGDGSPAVWRWSPPKVDAQSDELRARMVRGHLGRRLDIFQIDTAGEDRIKKFKTIWPSREVGSSDSALNEIKALFPGIDAFATPKPEKLLERIIHIATDPGDIVLDVFAGSGTTAAVAHKMGRRWVTAELLEKTISTFTLPRLTKVVRGEDPGGITSAPGERVDASEDGLPEGLTPEEAQKLTSLLNKAVRGEAKLKTDPALRQVKALVKTKTSPGQINWRGGGGFRVMKLSDDVFTYDPSRQLVMLTDAAHGDTLIASIAANLGFYRTPDAHPFHGRKGKMRLVVMEGAVTEQVVDDVLAHLPAGERVTIAALSVPDGVRKYLRERSRGSVIKHVPDDLFSFAGDLSTESIEG